MGNSRHDDWDEILPFAMSAYRSTPHESTKYSPYYMVYGREVTLPVDVMFGNPPCNVPQCATEYGEWLKESLQSAHQEARNHLKKAAERQKNYYDAKYSPHPYQVGEFVWRYVAKPARRKLTKGGEGPFRIVAIPNEQHCFLQRLPGQDPIRVHCDQLKPYQGKNPRGCGSTAGETPAPEVSAESDGSSDSHESGSETTDGSEDEAGVAKEAVESGSSEETELEITPPVGREPGSIESAVGKEQSSLESPKLGRGKRLKKPPNRYDW